MKHFKILILSLIIFGLAVEFAYAGAQLAVTPKKVSVEKTSTTPTPTYKPSATIVPSYQPGGLIAAGEKIKLSLTNGVFEADKIDICDGTNSVGSGTLGSDASTLEITLTSDISSLKVYTFRSEGAATSCEVADTLVIKINGGLSAGDAVTLATSNDPLRIDAGPIPVYSLVQQITAEVTGVTSKISFPDAMKKFKVDDDNSPPDTEATISKAKLIIKEATGIDDKVTLDVNEYFSLKIIGNLSGTKGKKIGYDKDDDGTYEASVTVADADITNGYVTFDVPGDKIGSGTDKGALGIEVDGTTVLTPRTFTTLLKTKIAGEIAREVILFDSLTHNWQLDASQYYIPLIGSYPDTGRETYIKLQSKSKVAGSNGVSVQILTSDGSIVTYDAGTITPGAPLVITGADLVAAATAAGKSVDGLAGFAAIITVNAPESDVFIYANMIDPSGAKRIPVKTVGGTIVE